MLLRMLLFAWAACTTANAALRGCSKTPPEADFTFHISVSSDQQGEVCTELENAEILYFLRGLVDAWMKAEVNTGLTVTSLQCKGEACDNSFRHLAKDGEEEEVKDEEHHRKLPGGWDYGGDVGCRGSFNNCDDSGGGRRAFAELDEEAMSEHLTVELQGLVDNSECDLCLQGNVMVTFTLGEADG